MGHYIQGLKKGGRVIKWAHSPISFSCYRALLQLYTLNFSISLVANIPSYIIQISVCDFGPHPPEEALEDMRKGKHTRFTSSTGLEVTRRDLRKILYLNSNQLKLYLFLTAEFVHLTCGQFLSLRLQLDGIWAFPASFQSYNN